MSAPVDHPPPWRWHREADRLTGPRDTLFAPGMRIPGGWALLDANGRTLVDKEMVFHLDGQPGLREQLRAAPEAEALLRRAAELVHWLTPFAFSYAAEHPGSNMPTKVDVDDVCRSSVALIDRLDAARKAGG